MILFTDTDWFTWNIRIDMMYDFVAGILLATAFIGLHKLSTMAFCGILAIYSLYSTILGIFFLPKPVSDILLHLSCLVCAVLVALYYYPRRPLFLVGITFSKWAKGNTPFAPFFANRCRYCCHKHDSSDSYCPKCGRFIIPDY